MKTKKTILNLAILQILLTCTSYTVYYKTFSGNEGNYINDNEHRKWNYWDKYGNRTGESIYFNGKKTN